MRRAGLAFVCVLLAGCGGGGVSSLAPAVGEFSVVVDGNPAEFLYGKLYRLRLFRDIGQGPVEVPAESAQIIYDATAGAGSSVDASGPEADYFMPTWPTSQGDFVCKVFENGSWRSAGSLLPISTVPGQTFTINATVTRQGGTPYPQAKIGLRFLQEGFSIETTSPPIGNNGNFSRLAPIDLHRLVIYPGSFQTTQLNHAVVNGVTYDLPAGIPVAHGGEGSTVNLTIDYQP